MYFESKDDTVIKQDIFGELYDNENKVIVTCIRGTVGA